MAEHLGELFRRARGYGAVNIFTGSRGGYHCAINFNTIEHTKLEAMSRHDHDTPEEAVRVAIASAEKIVASVSHMAKKIAIGSAL